MKKQLKNSTTHGKRRAESDEDESSSDDGCPAKHGWKVEPNHGKKSKTLNKGPEEIDLSDHDPQALGEVDVEPSKD